MRNKIQKGNPMSSVRKNYILRLVIRCLIFLACLTLYLTGKGSFGILEGMNFFQEFSVFHILWAVWMMDMIQQIIPMANKLPLASMKLFANRFQPNGEKYDQEGLRKYIITTTKAAYKVFVLWCGLLAVIGTLYHIGVLDKPMLFLISAAFYVCDLICVLIWCPFRLMMKTRCCTTCRIFNWDHLMMFSPLIFMGGFYGTSLVITAFAAWLLWEISIMMYPERFWEKTNQALKCSCCTDKLCTQYCGKKMN